MTVLIRRAAAAAAVASVATVASALPPAAAATPYSQPLRTAARQLPVAPEVNEGSDRDRYFGEWADTDRDCQNTRHEVLQQESSTAGTFTSARRCSVATGTWRSVYDGRTYRAASDVQVDHLIPVHEAWGSGARAWTQARRVAFYNDIGDPRALNVSGASVNSSKQAKGPEEWLPPTNRCWYITAWVAMKHRWRLRADARERDALVGYADSCPNVTVRVQQP